MIFRDERGGATCDRVSSFFFSFFWGGGGGSDQQFLPASLRELKRREEGKKVEKCAPLYIDPFRRRPRSSSRTRP